MDTNPKPHSLARAYTRGFNSLPGSGSPFIGWPGLEPLHRAFEQGQLDADAKP